MSEQVIQTNEANVKQEKSFKLGGPLAWTLWLLVGVFYVNWLFLFQTSYSIFNSGMAKDIGITLAEVGTIGAIYTWVFAISQFFSGALLDRLGARWLLPMASGTMVIGAFILANATSYEMVLMSQVVMAVGASFGFCGGGFIGGKWFGMAKFGMMFGLVQMSAALGSYFGVNWVVGKLFVDGMLWHELANMGAWVGFAIFALLLVGMRNPEPIEKVEGGLPTIMRDAVHNIVTVAKKPQVSLHAFVGGILFGVLLGMAVIWFPKLLMAHGFSQTEAGALGALTWLGLAFGSPAFNWWSDKIKGRKLPLIVGTAVQFAALAFIAFVEQTYVSAGIAIVIFGFANGAHMLNFNGAADTLVNEKRFDLIGTSAAWVNGLMFIGGGILMALPGQYLTDLSLANWQVALTPFWIGGVAALIGALLIKESYPKEL